jgi:hypothetical protein
MPFHPTQDYILIKPLKRRQSHTLEVVSYESFERGMIIAAGPGAYLRKKTVDKRITREKIFVACEVKPGDFIAYVDLGHMQNYYTPYHEDGVDYIIAQEKDVVFVGERAEIDAFGELSDADIARLIGAHNSTAETCDAA